jgi:hypothetical protein
MSSDYKFAPRVGMKLECMSNEKGIIQILADSNPLIRSCSKKLELKKF